MKQIIIGFLMILAVASLEFACTRPAHAQTAGLNYTTYAAGGATPSYTQAADGTINNRTQLSTGTVSTINYNWGGGGVLNSGRGDGVIVRFYGYINIPTAGTYTFGGNADDGIRLKVNNISVINSWQEDGGSFRQGSINLSAGPVPVELIYYENGGGALVNFQWYQNNAWQIVASTNLYTSMPAPQYASSITAAQQARVNAAANRLEAINQNGIYIDQVGNNTQINVNQIGRYNQVSGIGATNAPVQGDLNNITIRQGDPGSPTGKNLIEMSIQGTGSNTVNLNQGRDTVGNYTGVDVGGHYQSVSVAGYSNQVTTNQQNAGGVKGNYLEANIVGNYNTVGLVQTDGTTQKQTFASVNGNNNVLNASQTGLGNHYLDVSLNGNGNSATVNQYGNTANAATINMTNAGGPASVNLTQTGGQVYNITTVCVTVNGCAPITVRQGN
ncbi:PA14 domain containing protein [uncultured Caudovirales phage]|uniref:PA14 domain containing protein n=1 Tax=uncultured Caudovirales phage TaxID=2100421 RepID=A0A6J5L8A2_9CAUD|nr:PA14 domain containing protein [uncultured Caudovirales phage]